MLRVALYFAFIFPLLAWKSLHPPLASKISRLRVSTTENVDEVHTEERVIVLTDRAMNQLKIIKASKSEDTCLRMGVRAGGCSGMSYTMDLISASEVTNDDHVEEYEGIKCVVDPKSLMFLYGLQLDYSDELIGGGFKFSNPNADANCGCGKSFSV